ncbi:MAG: hypothetical protein M1358_10980, partial [Chloroflexi bacterium]|nr:hypothetical protein [Chloroflexota bacterium]
LGPAGASLVYGTYLGGYFRDGAYGLALGPSNAVYVCGLTASDDFPTTAGAYQPELSPSAPKVKYSDAFLAKLALNGAGGADLLYSTFLGGSHADDVATAVTIDASGVAYLTGSTESSQFPTTVGAYNSSFGGGYSNAFIAKLDPAGSGSADLLYSTFLGGDRGDHGLGIGLDAGGNILVAGSTTSDDFPVIDPGSATLTTGETLSFVVRLTPAGSEAFDLLYSTLLRIRDSSPLDESANALAIGPEGEVRLAGFSVIEFGRSAAYVKTVVIPPSYPVNVSVNPAAGGDVRPLARNYMGSVTFTAKATAGYSFTNWTVNGAAGVANNPLSLVITQPTTLVADFTLEFTHAVFLPVILDNAYGGWTTGLSIRNPSDSPTTIKIAYYDGGGNVVTTDSRNLVANGSVGVYQGGRFGGNWAGSAAILSNVPIVATVNEVGPDHSAMSYSGEVTPTTTVYLPVVMDNAYEGWSTGVAIRNASAKLASVSIIYYSANGAFSRWDSAILEGNGYLGLYQGGKFGGNWTGTAIITSDQPIAAVVNEMDKKGRAISYNGLFNESYDFYLPVVLNNAYGGWTTGIGVQSAIHDSYQSPTGVEVWYFDADGAQAGSQWVEVPRGGYSGLYQGGVGLAVGFSGSAFLHIGQPAIAAVVNEVPTTGDAMGYSAIVQPAQVVEIPLVMDNAYGGWSSGIGIENASQSSADVTVTYYDQDGGVIGSPSRTIAGRGYWGLYQGGALGGRAGSARIISTQPIAVVVNAIGPSGAAMSYNGSP